jgi:hypothetical protein
MSDLPQDSPFDPAEDAELEPWFLEHLLREHGGYLWRWRNGTWEPWIKIKTADERAVA